ncbi:13504_t:CDS:2 [Cetraspora pellucida]|uniref:13504_t:CDS:1 n=1 Tax=Cetraspora pellucida TaxID=1433469 RepID=A0A9N8ZNX2_9GLOM|nr:13504_t:CDS:2 [Cetraspora pellucida]
MSYNHYNHSFDVSAELGRLLQSSENFDVKITVGRDLDVKEFGAHSIILRARSVYFQKALSRHWAREEHGVYILTKPNISPDTFDAILKVIPEDIDELVLQYHLNPGTVDKSQIPPPRALRFRYEYINVDPHRNSNRRTRKALCEVPYRDENRKTLDSFIFSLTNRANPVLSRVASNTKDQAIFWDGMKGPCFGETDLFMKASSESADAPITVSTTYSSMSPSTSIRQHSQINWITKQKNYQRKITDTEVFDVEEYEVFILDNHYLQAVRIVNFILRRSFELARLGFERGYELYSEIPNDKWNIIFDACIVPIQ